MKKVISTVVLLTFAISIFAQSASWQERSSPKSSSINAIAVNSTTGRVYVSSLSFIAYSDNAGNDWNVLPTQNYFIADATSIDIHEATGRVVVGSGDGVNWTDDNGASLWNKDKIQTNPVSGFGVPVEVVKVNENTGTIFAGLFRAPGNNPFGNFTINNIGVNPFPVGGNPWQYGSLLAVVDYEVDDSGYVYMVYNSGTSNTALDGIYQSKDDGQSWVKQPINGTGLARFNDMAFTNYNTYYATTAGVYKKVFGSNNAILANGNLPVTNISKIETDRKGYVIYVLAEGKLYKSTDAGVNYSLVTTNFNNSNLTVIAADSLKCYAGNYTKAIYKHDEANNIVFEDVSGILSFSFNEQLEFAPNGVLYMRSSNGGLERSLDDGLSWEPILLTSPGSDFYCSGKFAIDGNNRLFVPSYEFSFMSVYMSADTGKTYIKTDSLPIITTSPGNNLFSVKGEVFLAYGPKLMKFDGNYWKDFFDGSSMPSNVASVDKMFKNSATGRYIMIVNNNGGFTKEVVYSDDNGASWTEAPFVTTTTLPATSEYFYWLGTSPVTFTTEIWKGDASGLNWIALSLPSSYVPHSSVVYNNNAQYCIAQDITSNPPTFTYLKSVDDFSSIEQLLNGFPLQTTFSNLTLSNQGGLYGYSAQFLYKYEAPNGIDDLGKPHIFVQPNPFADQFSFNGFERMDEVSIYSTLGQLVYHQRNYQPNTVIDLKLANGVYFAKCRVGNRNVVLKILRE